MKCCACNVEATKAQQHQAAEAVVLVESAGLALLACHWLCPECREGLISITESEGYDGS